MSEYPFLLDTADLLYQINLNVLDVVILFSLLEGNGFIFCELVILRVFNINVIHIWYGSDNVIFSKTVPPALIFEIMTLICFWDACYM